MITCRQSEWNEGVSSRLLHFARAGLFMALFASTCLLAGCNRTPPAIVKAKPPEVSFVHPVEKTVRDYEDYTGHTEAFKTDMNSVAGHRRADEDILRGRHGGQERAAAFRDRSAHLPGRTRKRNGHGSPSGRGPEAEKDFARPSERSSRRKAQTARKIWTMPWRTGKWPRQRWNSPGQMRKRLS